MKKNSRIIAIMVLLLSMVFTNVTIVNAKTDPSCEVWIKNKDTVKYDWYQIQNHKYTCYEYQGCPFYVENNKIVTDKASINKLSKMYAFEKIFIDVDKSRTMNAHVEAIENYEKILLENKAITTYWSFLGAAGAAFLVPESTAELSKDFLESAVDDVNIFKNPVALANCMALNQLEKSKDDYKELAISVKKKQYHNYKNIDSLLSRADKAFAGYSASIDLFNDTTFDKKTDILSAVKEMFASILSPIMKEDNLKYLTISNDDKEIIKSITELAVNVGKAKDFKDKFDNMKNTFNTLDFLQKFYTTLDSTYGYDCYKLYYDKSIKFLTDNKIN